MSINVNYEFVKKEMVHKRQNSVQKRFLKHFSQNFFVTIKELRRLRRLEMLELDLGRNLLISHEGVSRFCENLKGLQWLSTLNVIMAAENVEMTGGLYEKISGGLYEMLRSLKRLNELRLEFLVDLNQQGVNRKIEELMEMFSGKVEIIRGLRW